MYTPRLFRLILVLIFSTCFLFPLQAQKKPKTTKAERAALKAWAKKLKALSPLEFKAYVEEKQNLESRINAARSQTEVIQQELAQRDEQIKSLKETNKILEQENSEIDISLRLDKGIVFRVQVGAYEKSLITSTGISKTDLNIEKENGANKYTIGYFKDYWEADKFKKYLQSVGVSDAWIVSYKDGKRVDIKDVLKEVI